MPITPLHFGVLAPINHFAPKKMSNVSFIFATLWMDGEAIRNWLFNLPLPAHWWETHSFLSALIIGGLVSLMGVLVPPEGRITRKWIYGAFLGSISHILLDMLVHAEMNPLFPMKGNPFYMGWMEPLSMALLPLTVWLMAQYVSGSLDWLKRRRQAAAQP